MRKQTTRLTAFAALCSIAMTAHAQYTVTGVGRYDFTDNSGSGARELSGLAPYFSNYYAIGDKDALVHFMSLGIDNATGQITSASFSPSPRVLGSSASGDREAIRLLGSSLLIVNENGPTLEAYDPNSGASKGVPISSAVSGFETYANSRPNRAWESLTSFGSSDQRPILMANEDALTVDGPTANFTSGAWVRIQAASVDTANSTATAIGQFAYPIDAINGDNPFVTGETSGLVELLALPGGKVLAMERAVGLTGYRIRLYEINGDTATDVSGLAGLDGLTPGVDYKPLTKSLLWENTFSALTTSNFEGIALGPQLDEGGRSLILVADNASGPVLPVVGQQWTAQDQSLYALILDYTPEGGCVGDDQTGCLDGDLNVDGFVGINDLNIILTRWNQVVFPGSAPDPTVDGFVGIGDLNVVLGNWNSGTPPGALSDVPEPATATLAVVFCLWALLGRWRAVAPTR